MRIFGEWWRCDDGITRPVMATLIHDDAGQIHADRLLIDTGADRTVLSAVLLARLQTPSQPPPAGVALAGIAGASPFVVVSAILEFARSDGGPARIRGQFAAFTDPTATDLSILGRDVLDHFDLILSRPRGEILLLAGTHRYVVQ